MKVAVCVVTYLRPKGLARLLEGVRALRFDRVDAPSLEIVVVDNDPNGGAREVCRSLADTLPWPLRYANETRRGVSQARNRAVDEARAAGAEWIAFIDDDEVPDEHWLDELLRVQREYEADVVAGPVPPVFEGGAPAWVERGGFFAPRTFETGTRVEHPGAGNVLLRTSLLDGMDAPFDERFALTGGEDTHLFLRLARAGAVMVWAEEAIAHEWTPATRTRTRWILQRVYRSANTWSACERELDPAPRAMAGRVAKGVARIGIGLAMLPVSWMFGRHMMVRSLWYVCFGAGNLTGLTRLRYNEYKTVHGH